MKRSSWAPVLLCFLAFCPVTMRALAPMQSKIDTLSWSIIGSGVIYAAANGSNGNDIFVGIGGANAGQELVQKWVEALYAARLNTLGMRHIYSVRGPHQVGYLVRDIGTLDLARHLLSLAAATPAITRVIVAAHSSGAYVAHALFHDLYGATTGIDTSHVTDGKILYFLLDEAIGTLSGACELEDAAAMRLGHVYGVYGYTPSRNLYSYAPQQMIGLGNRYGSRSSSITLDGSASGCIGTFCLHAMMINQKPYNVSGGDPRDFLEINADHRVQAGYLDVIQALPLQDQQPTKFALEQNWPNPFNPFTIIKYTVGGNGAWGVGDGETGTRGSGPVLSGVEGLGTRKTRLVVYDLLGRQVATLVDEAKAPGSYEVKFDGSGLSSGVYIYRLAAGSFVQSKKMIVLK